MPTLLRNGTGGGHGMELDPNKHTAFAPELTPDPTKGA
jgi:hypothetical protein